MRCCETCANRSAGYCHLLCIAILNKMMGNCAYWLERIVVIPDEEMGEGAR